MSLRLSGRGRSSDSRARRQADHRARRQRVQSIFTRCAPIGSRRKRVSGTGRPPISSRSSLRLPRAERAPRADRTTTAAVTAPEPARRASCFSRTKAVPVAPIDQAKSAPRNDRVSHRGSERTIWQTVQADPEAQQLLEANIARMDPGVRPPPPRAGPGGRPAPLDRLGARLSSRVHASSVAATGVKGRPTTRTLRVVPLL